MPRFVSKHLGFFLLPFTLIYLASKVFFSLILQMKCNITAKSIFGL